MDAEPAAPTGKNCFLTERILLQKRTVFVILWREFFCEVTLMDYNLLMKLVSQMGTRLAMAGAETYRVE